MRLVLAFVLALVSSETIAKAKWEKCFDKVVSSNAGKLVWTRLFMGTETSADKFFDHGYFTPKERKAMLDYMVAIRPCRLLLLNEQPRYAVPWTDFFNRSDAVWFKLADGEITISEGNRLHVQSHGQFLADAARISSSLFVEQELQRQRFAQSLAQTAQDMQQSPASTTTVCRWVGNTLTCVTN
jgi:hypothetical protein